MAEALTVYLVLLARLLAGFPVASPAQQERRAAEVPQQVTAARYLRLVF